MRKDRWGPEGVTCKEKAQLLLTRTPTHGDVLVSRGVEPAGEVRRGLRERLVHEWSELLGRGKPGRSSSSLPQLPLL